MVLMRAFIVCLAALVLVGCKGPRNPMNPYDPLGPNSGYSASVFGGTCECAEVSFTGPTYYQSPCIKYTSGGLPLGVGTWDSTSGTTNAYMKFSLPGLPSDAKFISATLRFVILGGFDNYKLYRVDGPFGGATAWGSQPAATLLGQGPVPIYTYEISFDVSATVDAWLKASIPNNGFMLEVSKTPANTRIRENVSDAQLSIVYHL